MPKLTARLLSGRYLGITFKLIGNSIYGIKAIKTADSLPENFIPHSFNKISRPDSQVPIYIWGDREAKTIYVYTEAERIMLPADCDNLCKDYADLEDISFFFDQRLDNRWVATVKGAFEGCNRIPLLPKWYKKIKMAEEYLDGLAESDTDRAGDSDWDK